MRHPVTARLPGFFPANKQVTLTSPQQAAVTFDLYRQQRNLAEWFSDYFGYAITLAHNATQGFPDDRHSPGPTLVSQATLETVCQWFPGLTLVDLRRRFRTNLELSNTPAFWEDRLFGQKGQGRPFRIGAVQFLGINPCLRCVVPTRNPTTGEVTPGFVKVFSQQRRATLPDWIEDPAHFENAYRLTVNTQVKPESAGILLAIGDECRLESG